MFGSKSVYINAKKRVDSRELGRVVPDGFLFDLSDHDDPQFYLVEVEMRRHDFMKHVFPQLTKFFAFYKNPSSRSNLIDRLFELVSESPDIRKEFEDFLMRESELYKSIKDIIENSQNILLIADDNFPEVHEVQEIYADTWGKYVKSAVLKQHVDGQDTILILNPGFDELSNVGISSPSEDEEEGDVIYDEEYHLKDVDPNVREVYDAIKARMARLDPSIMFNPQHYYISIRKNRNFAFIHPRKNKLKIEVMLPLEVGRSLITNHRIKELSKGVQDFYNGPCFQVLVERTDNLEEIFEALERAYREVSND